MSVNKVILLGNLGKDPESRVLEGNRTVTTFSLATTDRAYKTASGTEIPERTEWHNVVAWNAAAEIAAKYLSKGSKVYIEGKLKNRNYTDNAGVKHYITEVFVDTLELIDSKKPVISTAPIQNNVPAPADPVVTEYASSNPDHLPF